MEFDQERQRFYKCFHRLPPTADTWHAMARTCVHRTTSQWFSELNQWAHPRILNAGSGGADYGICAPMVHYDLYKVSPEGNGEFIRGDVEEMPFSNESFDFVICVGSVLNYCDPTRCLSEISRILKPQGLLVLEYERSASAEFVWQRGFGSSACRFRTFFGSETTFIWAYSDSFVNGILALNQFVLVRSKWFHCLSALALALLRRPERAAHLMPFDGLLSKLRIATAVASNRILVAQKIPHHG